MMEIINNSQTTIKIRINLVVFKAVKAFTAKMV